VARLPAAGGDLMERGRFTGDSAGIATGGTTRYCRAPRPYRETEIPNTNRLPRAPIDMNATTRQKLNFFGSKDRPSDLSSPASRRCRAPLLSPGKLEGTCRLQESGWADQEQEHGEELWFNRDEEALAAGDHDSGSEMAGLPHIAATPRTCRVTSTPQERSSTSCGERDVLFCTGGLSHTIVRPRRRGRFGRRTDRDRTPPRPPASGCRKRRVTR